MAILRIISVGPLISYNMPLMDEAKTGTRRRLIIIALLLGLLAAIAYLVIKRVGFGREAFGQEYLLWAQGDAVDRASLITVQRETCPGAPFVLPADGFIGLLYADPRGPYSRTHRHQGIDIFSEGKAGVTPVYAAYDGYVSRESDWRSTLIMRVPDDPLGPGRQIWLYYTHMADREGDDFIVDAFPPGTDDVFVEQGTLLGYTGDYNGTSVRPVWVHLHFSIVRDDGHDRYRNELEFTNTIDPSPYLGMALNYRQASGVVGCVE